MRRETIEKGVTIFLNRKVTAWPSAKVCSVEGEHGTYLVVWHPPSESWVCNCKAGDEGVECSHVVAAELLDKQMKECDGWTK